MFELMVNMMKLQWHFELDVSSYMHLDKKLAANMLITLVYLLQVLSTLTLAAAASTASVVDLLLNSQGSFCPIKLCCRYRISAVMAFVSWFLSLASSLFNLYLLPSLWFSSNSPVKTLDRPFLFCNIFSNLAWEIHGLLVMHNYKSSQYVIGIVLSIEKIQCYIVYFSSVYSIVQWCQLFLFYSNKLGHFTHNNSE